MLASGCWDGKVLCVSAQDWVEILPAESERDMMRVFSRLVRKRRLRRAKLQIILCPPAYQICHLPYKETLTGGDLLCALEDDLEDFVDYPVFNAVVEPWVMPQGAAKAGAVVVAEREALEAWVHRCYRLGMVFSSLTTLESALSANLADATHDQPLAVLCWSKVGCVVLVCYQGEVVGCRNVLRSGGLVCAQADDSGWSFFWDSVEAYLDTLSIGEGRVGLAVIDQSFVAACATTYSLEHRGPLIHLMPVENMRVHGNIEGKGEMLAALGGGDAED